MLRDKSLIPLSHQHHQALALCVRLDRALKAGVVDLKAWQEEIQMSFEQEIKVHFNAEEKELFPAAVMFSELQPLVIELQGEHAVLRDMFSRATDRTLDPASLEILANTLSAHIRKEERQLFERMQQLMTATQLATLGEALGNALKEASVSCGIPNPATRLLPNAK